MPYATNTAFSCKQWASVLFHDERSPIFLLFRNADNLQPCISAWGFEFVVWKVVIYAQ